MSANSISPHIFQNRGELLRGIAQGNSTEGQTIRHYDQQVDAFHEPDYTPTFGVLEPRVDSEPKNRRRSRVSYDRLDIDDLFDWVTKQTPQELGGLDYTILKEWVDATGGPPSPLPNELHQIYSVVKPYDRAHSQRETATVDSWQIFTDEAEEPETGLEVLIERKILDASTMPAETKGVAREVKTVKILDEKKALIITRTIDAAILSSTFTEYHNVKYYFPSYMDAGNPVSISDIFDKIVVTVNKSSDHEFTIPCRFETTYHTSAVTPAEIFQFKPIDINLSEPPIFANNVLTDEGVLQFSLPYVTGTDVVGGLSTKQVETGFFSYGISASSPTTTEYLALMGTEVLIADEVTRWKYNLWQRTKVNLTIPDLSLGLGGYISY